VNPIQGGYGWVWKQEIKPTANRRESTLRVNRIGFADPHSRNTASLSCSSLIGSVRANPIGAPAPLAREIFRELFLWRRGGDIVIGSRWGGDRICPNVPDEG